MNLFYYRCRVSTFKVQSSAHHKIVNITNSKLRASAYKLYRWICCKTDSWDQVKTVSAKLKDIRKATGLSKHAIINARCELVHLGLIQAFFDGGPGGRYQLRILNAETGLPFYSWNEKPTPSYFPVPMASMFPVIFRDKWTGTDAIVYDELLKKMAWTGKNILPLSANWFDAVSKNTLYGSEECLVQTGFIRVKDAMIEVLHPESSESMPPIGAEQEPMDRAYYFDRDSGVRKRLHEEILAPGHFETYFRKSLPHGSEWSPGHDAHCPFHNDRTPSLSINCQTGQWFCHACNIGGEKLVTFEMRLLDTEDVQAAWASVAEKIGLKLCPRSRGKVTNKHVYRDEQGDPQYMVLRYENGSASYRRFAGFGTKPGLGGKKRMLYNLPEVIAADVVLFVEGEKKADILAQLSLSDASGKAVAVTTTGGADSWRFEYIEHLVGKRVLLMPDSDEPGRRHAADVEASLARAGIEHAIVYFDDYGNDVRDFLEDHSPDELVQYIDTPWLGAYEPEMEILI